MELVRLGASDLMVSRLCLGTMMYGEAFTCEQAGAQLSQASELGINFFDTAEMYPVPQRAETQGRSEEYLGRWLRSSRKDRSSVVLATKIAGPSAQMTWLRNGPQRVDAANIAAAVEGSLRRLCTDHIDLLQVHWPDRYVPMFGDVDFDPSCDYRDTVPIEEQLEALGRAVEQGKVRYIGLSNETAWGLHSFLSLSTRTTEGLQGRSQDATSSTGKQPGKPPEVPVKLQNSFAQKTRNTLPRVVSIQNAYSLLCRTFDSTLAETCFREDVALLPYSVLAMGLLTGKYHVAEGGKVPLAPPNARLVKYKGRYAEAEGRYPVEDPRVGRAVRRYVGLAREFGLSPPALALAFVLSHPLVPSAIVGASSNSQLTELIAAVNVVITPEMRAAIDIVHGEYPNPTP